jgi:3-methyladenine DNA glycosylase AlkC
MVTVKFKDKRYTNDKVKEYDNIDSLKQDTELTVRKHTQEYFATYTKQDSSTLIKDIRAYCKEDNDTEFLCEDENITIFKYITELQD